MDATSPSDARAPQAKGAAPRAAGRGARLRKKRDQLPEPARGGERCWRVCQRAYIDNVFDIFYCCSGGGLGVYLLEGVPACVH